MWEWVCVHGNKGTFQLFLDSGATVQEEVCGFLGVVQLNKPCNEAHRKPPNHTPGPPDALIDVL